MAGYSGTPLVKKLGLADRRVVLLHEPPDFRTKLVDLPETTELLTDYEGSVDVVVVFAKARADFEAALPQAGREVFPAGAIWIAWPKRASKIPTDMTEDVVRDVVLPLGLVDNKVCAIDEVWSGLRVVWRKELRSGPPP
ncbi:MAG: DUF3052 family protein [Myxococcota bacterium]